MAPSGFFSIRRKSVPKNGILGEQVSLNGQASMSAAQYESVHEVLHRPAPRPRSSWYSQPSVSEEAPAVPAIPVPRMPDQYLKEMAAYGPENGKPYPPIVVPAPSRSDSRDSWEDESPGGTRQNSRNKQKHTAVSEYLRDRSWQAKSPRSTMPGAFVDEYPEPYLPHPPTPSNRPLSMLRRFSGRRDSRRDSYDSEPDYEPVEQPPRRESILQQASRRASSIKTTWPYSMLAKAQPPSESPTSPISYVSTPRIPDSSTSRTPRTPYTPFTEPFAATPYHTTRPGPAPTPIKSIHYQLPPDTPSVDPNSSMKRGLTKHYGKGVTRRRSVTSTTLSSTLSPPSYHTSQHEEIQTPYPVPAGSRLLMGGSAEARERSYEGYWLFIGTMRGPTPSGVRIIDEIMAKSLSKKGNTDKGVKEIRKVLRHEKRTVIEWVENYVRGKWGVEV